MSSVNKNQRGKRKVVEQQSAINEESNTDINPDNSNAPIRIKHDPGAPKIQATTINTEKIPKTQKRVSNRKNTSARSALDVMDDEHNPTAAQTDEAVEPAESSNIIESQVRPATGPMEIAIMNQEQNIDDLRNELFAFRAKILNEREDLLEWMTTLKNSMDSLRAALSRSRGLSIAAVALKSFLSNQDIEEVNAAVEKALSSVDEKPASTPKKPATSGPNISRPEDQEDAAEEEEEEYAKLKAMLNVEAREERKPTLVHAQQHHQAASQQLPHDPRKEELVKQMFMRFKAITEKSEKNLGRQCSALANQMNKAAQHFANLSEHVRDLETRLESLGNEQESLSKLYWKEHRIMIGYNRWERRYNPNVSALLETVVMAPIVPSSAPQLASQEIGSEIAQANKPTEVGTTKQEAPEIHGLTAYQHNEGASATELAVEGDGTLQTETQGAPDDQQPTFSSPLQEQINLGTRGGRGRGRGRGRGSGRGGQGRRGGRGAAAAAAAAAQQTQNSVKSLMRHPYIVF